MFKDEFYISTLLAGHVRGDLNPGQQEELNTWLNLSADNRTYFESLSDSNLLNTKLKRMDEIDGLSIWNKTTEGLGVSFELNEKLTKEKGFVLKLWPGIAVAASIIILLSASIYFYTQRNPGASILSAANDIHPGNKGATLTLANGKKIRLADAVEGKLASESGMSITKTKEGQIVYELFPAKEIASDAKKNLNGSVSYNTLSTAKGETYQIILPDKSTVWLNAASSLKYPVSFASLKERKVELIGEGYFQVSHNARQPFKVQTGRQVIEDIGTAFNVNSYADEPDIKTTLVEGSVRVSLNSLAAPGNEVLLKPGQKSTLQGQTLQVSTADIASSLAWKNGDFIFKNDDIRVIMRQIARWYNVEVVYAASMPDHIQLGGYVSRSKNISSILTIMEATGKVHFKLEGRRVIVTP